MELQLALLDAEQQAVSRINTSEDVKDFIKGLDTLKALLDAADKFGEMARKYAMLEAAAYVRIVALGLEKSIPTSGSRRSIALWLSSLDESERMEVIEICGSDGITIKAYWKEKVYEPEMVEEAIHSYQIMGEMAIDSFKDNGVVNINTFLDSYLTKKEVQRIPEDFRKGYKDQLRDRIRRLGGHGIGDGDGTYVTVEKANGYAESLVENKLRSLRQDIVRLSTTLRELKELGGFELELPIERSANNCYDLSIEGAINLGLSLTYFGEPYFRYEDTTVAKMLAKACSDLGWPILKIKSTIEDEYGSTCGNCSTTGMYLLGYDRTLRGTWSYSGEMSDTEFKLEGGAWKPTTWTASSRSRR